MSNLVLAILEGRIEGPDSAYRAMLAAECLDSSAARDNVHLIGQVFDALKTSIQDKATAKVGKVECWQALGRLQLGRVQLGELPQMMEDDSRFVREEALKTIALLGQEPLPGCRPVEKRLIWEAARLGALDRLREYRKWVFASSLRSFTLIAGFIIATIISLICWIVPAPIIFGVVGYSLPPLLFWWMIPSLVTVIVGMLELFLWLNEDKRSFHGCLLALRGAISRLTYTSKTVNAAKRPEIDCLEAHHTAVQSAPSILEEDRIRLIERFRAWRALSFWAVPLLLVICFLAIGLGIAYYREAIRYEREVVKQENEVIKQEHYAENATRRSEIGRRTNPPPLPIGKLPKKIKIPSTLDKWTILTIADAIATTKDLQKFMLSQGLATDEDSVARLSNNPTLRLALIKEIRKFAYLVDVSGEINYQVKLEALAELCSHFIGGQSTESSPATEIVYALRREARSTGISRYLRFDEHYKITDKEKYLQQILPEEVEFLSQVWQAHTYLRILWANGMISSILLDRAEDAGDEEWFAGASREMLAEVGRLLSGGTQLIPRSSAILAFEKLGEAIGHPEAHHTAVQSALSVLEEDRSRWIAARREAEEARRRAEEARRRAQEERLRAWEARLKQIGIIAFLLFIIACIVWLCWKYIIPRIELARLDASLQEDITKLRTLAADDTRDMALRKAALRKLASSDDPQARRELLSIINNPHTPETLGIEAHRALYHQQRRQMRRFSVD